MYHDLDPRITELTEMDTAPVRWPDPSPLQAWWNDIMAGTGTDLAARRAGHRAPRLRPA
ncbi:hypothetical protein [Nocardia asteroides]|uniref:Uncharacterized protein n=1 Tax=Nocardia asteroides NBRC 15531 TaxID=1110697 RepID=U5EF40_NOCAS|nr:hypothetical protein [Nocardia asteroides]UGT51224.1 hypothetical protein LT345_12090 [Nocardia asteroides]GAD85940.1 hypothetical protein NCAST_32_04250 [Nocardia asteroides NBRC 15531]SFM31882.1 hypothetical protein SAMN05444423_102678 [Nocardia asteroides]VEG35894.1 Uncharacterised protein [Nocardia asteroides]